jgi:hypothetical protein
MSTGPGPAVTSLTGPATLTCLPAAWQAGGGKP